MWAALTLDVRHTLWPNERISFVGFQILMRYNVSSQVC